jgi:hypothetical protein
LNKIVSTKILNAIFLVIVLVAGTFAAVSPSFIVKAEPYYEMDRYNSYEPDYGVNNDRKSYGNDNYESTDYPSYKPDYKPSYGKDNNYKSKDNVIVKPLNCINTNFNTNGNINGDINTFSPSRTATDSDEGDLGAGNNDEVDWGYGDGYQNKKDKDFACIINNNNTINNVIEGNGNVTDGNVPDTCEECFEEFLTPAEISALLVPNTEYTDLEDLCNAIFEGPITEESLSDFLEDEIPSIDRDTINQIIECLMEVGVEFREESGFNAQDGSIDAQGGLGSSLPTPGGLLNLR